MQTSYSGLSQHRTCPQAWGYSNIEKLRRIPSVGDGIARDFGIWWHLIRAASSLQRGVRHGSLKIVPKELNGPDKVKVPVEGDLSFKYLVEAVMLPWWKGLTEEVRQMWIEQIGQNPLHRLVHMDTEYRKRWEEELEIEKPLGVEVGWKRPIRDGGEVTLVGYVDEVYFDPKRNLTVARDHKTSTDITRNGSIDDLMDSQLHIYAWGAYRRLAEHGFKINAISYDRARVKAPSTPKLNQSGTLSKSTSDYDLATYLKWVGEGLEYPGTKKDGSGKGIYTVDQNVVDHLSTPVWKARWFDRTLTPLNRNVIEAHLLAAADTAKFIPLTIERFEAGEPAPRNFSSSCKWCDFRLLCAAQLVGGDGEYEVEEFNLMREGGEK